MKAKLVFVLVPALFLVTACGQNSNQAAADLIRACELVNAGNRTIDSTAVQFFASAARADIQYLPLVQAARLAQVDVFSVNESIRTEIVKASTLILGYCTPSQAK
jgi:hypothetical protein